MTELNHKLPQRVKLTLPDDQVAYNTHTNGTVLTLPWDHADALLKIKWAKLTAEPETPQELPKWTGPDLGAEVLAKQDTKVADLESQIATLKDQMLAFMAAQQGRVELTIPDAPRGKPGPKPKYREPNPDNAAMPDGDVAATEVIAETK